MAAGEQPRLAEVSRRVAALELELDELRELVDGQESWSHRKRLHALEGDEAARRLLASALEEVRQARYGKAALIAQWGSLIVAAVALVIALGHGSP